MKRNILASMVAVLSIGTTLSLTGCGDDNENDDNDQTTDAPDADGGDDADVTPDAPGPATYKQVEHLARPGIAEALLISNDYLAGYNATAPNFTGVPTDVLNAVVGEAKTVLKALYYGVCLVDGLVPGLTADTGLKPGGFTCVEIGGAIFVENSATGVNIKPTVAAAAQMYADKMFGQFVPDVMRIDTTAPSGYLTLCGDANSAPLLCGGRRLSDDSIDITYDYLLSGAAIGPTSPAQFRALVSDGVSITADPTQAAANFSLATPNPANPNQFHPPVSNTFPYSAPPI